MFSNARFRHDLDEIDAFYPGQSIDVWIGCNKLNGSWNWTDGAAFQFTNWQTGSAEMHFVSVYFKVFRIFYCRKWARVLLDFVFSKKSTFTTRNIEVGDMKLF
jgi:hypothetical protein